MSHEEREGRVIHLSEGDPHRPKPLIERMGIRLPLERLNVGDSSRERRQLASTPPLGGREGVKVRREKMSGRRGGLDAVRAGTISRGLWFLGGTATLTIILSLVFPEAAGYIIASGAGTIFGTLVSTGFVVWLTTVGIRNCNKFIKRVDKMFKKK